MDFARKQMEKYGWRDGQGLGKNEDGISKAITPKLKFDKTGVGHNPGDEFTDHWWESVFNNAAQNINVKPDGVTISINNKNNEKKKQKEGYKNRFIKTSKLTSSGHEEFVVNNNSTSLPSTSKNFINLTDDELFAACGGRTAHKGARHGLKLSGKLSRLEKQEKMLLKKLKCSQGCEDENKIIKKLKKLNLEQNKLQDDDGIDATSDCSSTSGKGKKKKKAKRNVRFNETIQEFYIPEPEVSEESSLEEIRHIQPLDDNSPDEGIVNDFEENNNKSDDHQNFEEPQVVGRDLSKAERKKLKKKRKLEDKQNTATMRFLEMIQDGDEENPDIQDNQVLNLDSNKKRKLNIQMVEHAEHRFTQTEFPGRIARKREKKKKDKKRKLELKLIAKLDDCKIND